MTRRLTFAMVAVVAGALVLAVLGSTVVLGVRARAETEDRLREQARELAVAIDPVQNREVLRATGRLLRLNGQSVNRISAEGRIEGPLPEGVDRADLDVERLGAGGTLSGNHGNLVYAAAADRRGRTLLLVVLTRRVTLTRQGQGVVFAVSSLIALVLAVAVAIRLGRRLTRPVRDAEATARRIAAGDLAARVPPPAHSGDELATLATSINDMAAALERSRGLERQFLLSVSHDLRTPLTSIRGYAEAIADGTAPEPRRAAGVISSESRRLERLVQDLLELARLDARRFSLDVRSTDAREVVTDVAEGFRRAGDDVGIRLDLDTDAPAPSVAADPDRLAQVVANLVENALKFASTEIRAGVEEVGGGVALWVEDDGPGIDPDDLPHVFERFYSSNRTPARQMGSGLGLAIVKELVEAMGGAVRADPSTSERGARVVVTLRTWSVAQGSAAGSGRDGERLRG